MSEKPLNIAEFKEQLEVFAWIPSLDGKYKIREYSKSPKEYELDDLLCEICEIDGQELAYVFDSEDKIYGQGITLLMGFPTNMAQISYITKNKKWICYIRFSDALITIEKFIA